MTPELFHWFRKGDALPVVLLHGFTGTVASWARVADRMSSVATAVVALHLPGHHAAAPVAETWDANIDWVIATLGAHGIERCQLVGYSLGARTALAVAMRRPALVDDLVLIGVHPGLTSDAERHERRVADAVWIHILESEGIDAFVDQWEALPIFASQSAAAVVQQRAIRLAHDPLALAASLRFMGLAEMPDYRTQFRARTMSGRVVVGIEDKKFYRLARQMIAAPIGLWGCGHNPVVDRPQDVAELLGHGCARSV